MSGKAIGSRTQVMNGNANHTKGGLTKKDLMYNINHIFKNFIFYYCYYQYDYNL
jgi:hypothetical protein